ncbi:hypothetical protein [Tropicibacter sp. S64]|uniref:hypothetical protein n=1 Tax=Tropicibacter sp. S64 TaxID=3415122 RepID=UPI003C79A61E
MIPTICPPRVGGETIAILGTPEVPGAVLNQCLACRGYLPIMVTRPQELRNLFGNSLVSALVVMESVPVETTLDLCRDLRTAHRVTPIVALLSEPNRARGVELLEAGADHFDIQPVQVEDLLRALHAFTRRTFRMPGWLTVHDSCR